MSKGNTFENDVLKLIFQGTDIALLADNATTAPLTNLFISLHTGDPGEAGNQGTSESAYNTYARQSVGRTATGFVVAANVASFNANVDFPESTDTDPNVTHFGIGDLTAATSGKLMYSGTVTPNINIQLGVTPRLTTAATITED